MQTIVVWNPKNLCVSSKPREKVILLDKSIQWAQRYKLVTGGRYLLTDIKKKELEKVTIITSATFRDVEDYPSFIDSIFKEVTWYATLPLKLTFLRRVWMDGETILSEERLEGQEIEINLNQPIREDLAPRIREQLLTFQGYHKFLQDSALIHAESIGEKHQNYTIGYRKTGEPKPKAVFYSHHAGWSTVVISGTEQAYEAISSSGREPRYDIQKFTSDSFVDIMDAAARPELGVTFTPSIETGLFTKGTVNIEGKSKDGYVIHPNSAPTEGLLNWLYQIGRLVAPPKIVSLPIMEHVLKGRRVAFHQGEREFYVNGWDGTATWVEDLPIVLPLLKEDDGKCVIVTDGSSCYYLNAPGVPQYADETNLAALKRKALEGWMAENKISATHVNFYVQADYVNSGNFSLEQKEGDIRINQWGWGKDYEWNRNRVSYLDNVWHPIAGREVALVDGKWYIRKV